jgi:uncharacterized membrane protein YsdA (DUF1294 family)/cold shock CspA family protein
MRVKGKIRSWNDERGFGFVGPGDGGADVFLHISAFANRHRRPEVGQTVTYTLSTDDQGRPQAEKAALPGDKLLTRRRKPGAFLAFIVVAVFFGLVVFLTMAEKIPRVILWIYLGVSLLTYIAYTLDKVAARNGARRISEANLHWLSFGGGWPGALIAQQTLRHKSKKQSFRSAFWITVALNLGVLAWLFTRTNPGLLQTWVVEEPTPLSTGGKATIEWVDPPEQ